MKMLIFALFFLSLFLRASIQFTFDIEERFLYQLDGGCKNVDCRFDSQQLEKLKYCKIVHGYLRISEMNMTKVIASDVREITGYLLIDRVKKLKSLYEIFPNLTTIGGEILHNGNSLVITHNRDLENIGLSSLIHIDAGNVRIEKNRILCFVKTIKWEFLRNSIVVKPKNYDARCREICPNKFKNCWSEKLPQLKTGDEKCSKTTNCCPGNFSNCESKICEDFLFTGLEKDFDKNLSKCTKNETNSLNLENRYLVSKETCNLIGRIYFEESCIKKDDCPSQRRFIYNEDKNTCEYCNECFKHNCTIIVENSKDIESLQENCVKADIIKIRYYERDIEKGLKRQNKLRRVLNSIEKIDSCLHVENSVLSNLYDFKNLKVVHGNFHKDCIDYGRFLTIKITNNEVTDLFPYTISVKNGTVDISNNEKLCKDDEEIFEKLFYTRISNVTFDFYENDCKAPEVSYQIIERATKAIIITDFIFDEELSYVFIQDKFYATFSDAKRSFTSHYITISVLKIYNLDSNEKYYFSNQIKNEEEYIISFYHAIPVTTLKSDVTINEPQTMPTVNSITLQWNLTDDAKFRNTSYFFYIRHKAVSNGDCDKSSKNLQEEFPENFGLHFFKDEFFELVENDFNILTIEQDIKPSTCYEIEIYSCIEVSKVLCLDRWIIYTKTLSKFNFITIISITICLTIIIIIIYLKYFKRHTNKDRNDHQEMIDKWKINREEIKQTKFLGRGEFGNVFEGFLNSDKNKKVAVKTLTTRSETLEESFLKEAEIMRNFNSHHVVRLIGHVLDSKPLMVVMELMINGDLKQFLRNNRPQVENTNFNATSTSEYTVAKVCNTLHGIRPVHEMAIEIADGMSYLASLNFIHNDLAARNCMVDENYTIKIGDFGMTRELYLNEYYKPGNRYKKIPLRWMAPEALGTENKMPRFTTKSDVFSFGIVIFELVTFCEIPYKDMTDEEVIDFIRWGKVMEKPENCDEKIHNLMLKCWEFNPNKRINFYEIVEFLLENFKINESFKSVSYFHKTISKK